MYVSRCVYVDGFHVYPDSDCPHTWDSDELGPVVPTGWTVQTGQAFNPPLERQRSDHSSQDQAGGKRV